MRSAALGSSGKITSLRNPGAMNTKKAAVCAREESRKPGIFFVALVGGSVTITQLKIRRK